MSASESAKRRWHRESEERCPHCAGSGRVMTTTAQTRARAGGNAAYLNSLKTGALTMVERGKLGGRPKALTLEDLDAGAPEGGSAPPGDAGAQFTKQPRRTTARKRHKISRRGEYDECEICHAQRYKRSLQVRGKWITGMGRWSPSADCPGYNPYQWEMVNGELRRWNHEPDDADRQS